MIPSKDGGNAAGSANSREAPLNLEMRVFQLPHSLASNFISLLFPGVGTPCLALAVSPPAVSRGACSSCCKSIPGAFPRVHLLLAANGLLFDVALHMRKRPLRIVTVCHVRIYWLVPSQRTWSLITSSPLFTCWLLLNNWCSRSALCGTLSSRALRAPPRWCSPLLRRVNAVTVASPGGNVGPVLTQPHHHVTQRMRLADTSEEPRPRAVECGPPTNRVLFASL